ncbi:MAG: RDD family protein [Actinobacteria bacterium]|nr:RDD family protein [Actinomycetota bacterium]
MSVATTAPDPTILGPALSGTVPAPVGRRIGASLIDGALLLAVELVGFLVFRYVLWGFALPAWFAVYRLVSSILGYWVAETVLGQNGFIAILVLVWGFAQWRLHATTGQTLGKRAVGIRTLAVPTGGAPGWGRTLGRYLLFGLSSLLCGIGQFLFALSVFWDSDRLLRAWHDKAANVFLIDTRNGRDPLAPGVDAVSTQVSPQAPEGAPVATPVAARVQPAAVLPAPIAAPAVPGAASAALPTAARPAEAVAPPVDPSAAAPAWAAAPLPPVPAPPVPAPPVRDVGAPAPGTGIISSVPGLPAVGRPFLPPPPPPPPPPVQAPSDVRPSAPPAVLPFSPLPAPPADDDDAEMTVMSVDPVAQVVQVRLVFDTGDVLPVTGRGRIGRDPVVGDEPLSHLVPLADTTKSVSKTHLEFALGEGGLWVRDLHSTNGSSIEHSGARTPLPAGEWVRADPGAVVHLGSRTFRVEVP